MKERSVKTLGLLRRESFARPLGKDWEAAVRKSVRSQVVDKIRKDEVRAQKSAAKARTWFVK